MKRKEEPAVYLLSKRHPAPTPPMLINEIARLFHAKMRESDPGDSIRQESSRQIMRVLSYADGCSQLELVQKTHLKPPTVSVTLGRMEEEGLVTRENDPMDMRVVRVHLSEKGKAYNRRVLDRLHEVDNALMQGFNEEETACLLQYLERIRDNILPDACKNHSGF